MRLLLASTALALLIGLSPASAMCGGDGQQAGMCGGKPAASKNMSEWPMAPGKAQAEQQKSGMAMCPCCKNMAMMDGMKDDDPHKGMDMQKQ
jgi:hypothetical protein